MIVVSRAQAFEPLIVSARVTNLPGDPVNTSATWKGCDKKRSILRARATASLVVFGKLIHAENGDDVLQRFVTLQDGLHLACHVDSAPRRRRAARRMREVESSGSTAG